jgi:8-oxo-dGTP pyrophosphatase MutT (NUDIX family)
MDQLSVHQHRMTSLERHRIRTTDWNTLYENIMASKDARFMQREKRRAKSLYDSVDIADFLDGARTEYDEPPWEFPKGRRFTQETDIRCAIREFEEESNVPASDVLAFTETMFMERFIGINNRTFQNKYFLAFAHPGTRGPFLDIDNTNQAAEVNDARWFKIPEALEALRPFHEKKRDVLLASHQAILNILNE